MSNTLSIPVIGMAAALACATAASAQPADVPMDTPTTIGGVEVVCTGIGDTAQHDPRWAAYPLKIMLAGKNGQWMSDAVVTVARGKSPVVAAHCGGPWLLAKVAAGTYEISGTLDDEGTSATTKAVVSGKGQTRAILRFPNAGGSVSPQHPPSKP